MMIEPADIHESLRHAQAAVQHQPFVQQVGRHRHNGQQGVLIKPEASQDGPHGNQRRRAGEFGQKQGLDGIG